MLEFDKDHKAKFDTVTEVDAPAYLTFLRHQVDRHDHEVENAMAMKIEHETLFQLWDSAISRHHEKALAVIALIETLKSKFDIKEY